MITAAIVVAAGSAATEAHELLAAISASTDAPVHLVPLVDAPGAVILHALPAASASADALTLVVFCGHVLRDYDGRLFFSSRADGTPTPLIAVPIDAVRDAMRSSRQPIVVIFDCTFPDVDRLGALEQSFAGLAVGVVVSNARSMGLDGGIARALADGIATRDADLDGDGVVTLDELFAYARRRVEQVGLPPHCIVSSSRARAMTVVRFRDRDLVDDHMESTVSRRRAVRPDPAAYAPQPVPSSASPPPPPSPPAASPLPGGASGSRRPTPGPARSRRLIRPIAVIGTAALGAAAVLGAFVSTGNKSSRSALPPTFAAAPTTSAFAALGGQKLAAACTRGPNRFAVAVATSSSAVPPLVAAILSIDGGPDTRIALARTAGDVTAPPGVSLYAADVAPFARAGALRWGVQLSAPGQVRTVAILCGLTVQVLSH